MSKIKVGVNDLETWCRENNRLDLLNEWDYEKNSNISPQSVCYGSRNSVWWICKEGHSYELPLERKTKKISPVNCPVCNGKRVQRGVNDLETWCKKNNQDYILQEWDCEKNNLKPTEVTFGCQKKIWWICDHEHSYNARISDKTKGEGCPICVNKLVLNGYNDLITWCKNNGRLELLQEWDKEKNTILPTSVTFGTPKKVWWICPKGHSYEQQIQKRTTNKLGCPYCSHQKLLKGYNDFITGCKQNNRLDLLQEWDYQKNQFLPEETFYTANKKAWWKCPKGHEYQTQIQSRTYRKSGCPICNAETQTSFPEQAVFYYIKKIFADTINGATDIISPYELDIYVPTRKIAIEYDGQVFHSKKKNIDRDIQKNNKCLNSGITLYRIRESKCPELPIVNNVITYKYNYEYDHYCNLSGIIKQIVYEIDDTINTDFINVDKDKNEILKALLRDKKENSIAVLYPELVKEWDYTKNNNILPEYVTPRTAKQFWWICGKGHSYESKVANRTKGSGCPYCSNPPRKVLAGFNDLPTTHPHLLNIWNYDKNTIHPTEVTYGSLKKVWWKCPKCNNSYEQSVHSRSISQYSDCPDCVKKQIAHQYSISRTKNNSLAEKYPNLLAEWDKENELSPDEVSCKNGKKAKWICSVCGYKWSASINSRTTQGCGCPQCSKVKRGKTFHQNRIKGNSLAELYPELLSEYDYDKNPLSPYDISKFSDEKVWWLCSNCQHSWSAVVATRTKLKTGCPICANKIRGKQFAKKIVNLDTGEIFDSLEEACQKYHKDKSNLTAHLKGRLKTWNRQHWAYYDKDEII